MPKLAKELGPLAVSKLTYDGVLDAIAERQDQRPPADRPLLVNVGGVAGLHMQITPNNAKSWVLRYKIGERRRAHGLGPFPEIGLAKAREMAAERRAAIRQGIDPIDTRKAARAALIEQQRAERAAEQAELRTFDAVFREYLPTVFAKVDTERSQDRWQQSIEHHVLPIIGDTRIDRITAADIARVMQQPYKHPRTGAKGEFWSTAPETARKTLRRVAVLFDFANAKQYRTGDNPATWAPGTLLETLLPALNKVEASKNQPSLPPEMASAWFKAFKRHGGISASALQFVVLTACRSREARAATWSEINFKRAVWTIPKERMKAKREHVVPLCERAVALLRNLHGTSKPADALVFPNDAGNELTDTALSNIMRDMHAAELKAKRNGWTDKDGKRGANVHGWRATFKTWADEHAEYPPEMVELALAHAVGNEVERAYRRGSMIEKRRSMMTAWADFLIGEAQS